MSNGILTRQEEERLRTFRDNLALENSSADSKTLATLDRASSDRLIMEARLAAISVHDGDQHLQDLSALSHSNDHRNRSTGCGYSFV